MSINHEFLIFRLDEESFALKTTDIQEIVQYESITPIPRTPLYVAGIMNFRGSLLTVLDPAEQLFKNNKLANRNPGYIIIANVNSMPIGLIASSVDDIVKSEIIDFTEDPHNAQLLNNIKKEFCKGIINWTINKTETNCILLDLVALTNPSDAI